MLRADLLDAMNYRMRARARKLLSKFWRRSAPALAQWWRFDEPQGGDRPDHRRQHGSHQDRLRGRRWRRLREPQEVEQPVVGRSRTRLQPPGEIGLEVEHRREHRCTRRPAAGSAPRRRGARRQSSAGRKPDAEGEVGQQQGRQRTPPLGSVSSRRRSRCRPRLIAPERTARRSRSRTKAIRRRPRTSTSEFDECRTKRPRAARKAYGLDLQAAVEGRG